MTPEEIANRIHEHMRTVDCASTVEYVNAAYHALDKIDADTPGGAFTSVDVSVVQPSPDENLLREIHEEPSDSVVLDITFQMKNPLEFVALFFTVENF